MLMRANIYVKTNINREKGHYMAKNESIYKEGTAIIYAHMTNYRTSIYVKKSTELKESNTIILQIINPSVNK